MEHNFLTVAEIADDVKVDQQTVRTWIDRGELPAVRIGCCRSR
jgi:excisionase family DNA binding protein